MQWEVRKVPNTAVGDSPGEVSAKYLGVRFTLDLTWDRTLGALKSSVARELARLRQARAPHEVINEVAMAMIAAKVSFAAQVAMVPRELLQEWEERVAGLILRDLGLTTDAAKGKRRHFLYASETEGGCGFTGIEDAVRSEQLVGFMARRTAVGTIHAEYAKCQDASLHRMVEAGETTWEGTVTSGTGKKAEWGMQRVYAALPKGGAIAYAPVPWEIEGGGRGEGMQTHLPGVLAQLVESGALATTRSQVREY